MGIKSSKTLESLRVLNTMIKDKLNEKTDIDEIVSHFSCLICYRIPLDPIKCTLCHKIYCSDCLPDGVLDRRCASIKKYKCYMKCGSETVTQLTQIERKVLNELKFEC